MRIPRVSHLPSLPPSPGRAGLLEEMAEAALRLRVSAPLSEEKAAPLATTCNRFSSRHPCPPLRPYKPPPPNFVLAPHQPLRRPEPQPGLGLTHREAAQQRRQRRQRWRLLASPHKTHHPTQIKGALERLAAAAFYKVGGGADPNRGPNRCPRPLPLTVLGRSFECLRWTTQQASRPPSPLHHRWTAEGPRGE